MIDLIKTLVQTLVQAIPQIRGMRTDKRRRQVGATLFILYVRLNETMLAADDIIGSLEDYVAKMQRYLSAPWPGGVSGGIRIRRKVQHQITNFVRLHALLYDSSIILQIIDDESYNRLIPLLDRKYGALLVLCRIMQSGSLPLLPEADELEELMKHGSDIALWGPGRDLEVLQAASDRIHCWAENTLSTTAKWGEDVYERVVAYLQERKPREQLAEIRESLSSLRKALESNFSIADILLEVGDRRMEAPPF